MKKILALLIAFVFCLPLFGCNQKMQITIACDEYLIDTPCITRAVEYFESHSNTEINLIPYTKEILQNQVADVLIHPLDADMIGVGMAETFYDFSGEEWINDIQGYCYDSVMHNGHVYGLPFGTAYVTGCFYNKKIFKEYGLEVPKTQQEFDKVCDTLAEKGITPLFIAGGDVWPVAYQMGLETIFKRRPAYTSELNSGDAIMAEIPGVSLMVDWWKKGSDNGWFGKNWYDVKFSKAAEMLGEGEATMIICSDNWINTNLSSGYTYKSTDFGIMPIFMGVNTDGFVSGSQVCMISVLKNSSKAGIALDFVLALSDPEVYNLCYSAVQTIPILNSQMGIVTSEQYDSLDSSRIGSMSAFYPRIEGFDQPAGAKSIIDYTKGIISLEQCLEGLGNAK